jgi:hypothetical protein
VNSKKKLAIFALVVAIVPAVLAACGGQAANDSSNTGAQQQFLEERKGTPDPNYTPMPGYIAGAPGAIGIVQKVDGRNITARNPQSGSIITIHLDDGARLTTQVEARLSDVKVGDSITAAGALEGDVLKASMVQIGGGDTGAVTFTSGGQGDAGGSVTYGTGAVQAPGGSGGDSLSVPPPGTPGLPGTPVTLSGVKAPNMASGTVEQINGEMLVIKTQDGKTTTVQVTTNTHLEKKVETDPSKIQPGMTVIATGDQKGDIFEATAINVLQSINPSPTTATPNK